MSFYHFIEANVKQVLTYSVDLDANLKVGSESIVHRAVSDDWLTSRFLDISSKVRCSKICSNMQSGRSNKFILDPNGISMLFLHKNCVQQLFRDDKERKVIFWFLNYTKSLQKINLVSVAKAKVFFCLTLTLTAQRCQLLRKIYRRKSPQIGSVVLTEALGTCV